MLRNAIVVLTCNQIDLTKSFWGFIIEQTTGRHNGETGLVVVDNGSSDGTVEFLQRFIIHPHFPHHVIVRNPTNKGLFVGYNQGWQAMEAENYSFLHNDLYIYAHGWNDQINDLFARNFNFGLAGFCGARVAAANGGREDVMSNMVEAEVHGARIAGLRGCAVVDGMAIMMRRKVLEQIKGFDESYPVHHYYDKDISLAAAHAGWQNIVQGTYCHHQSGVTANNVLLPEDVHDKALERYLTKWGRYLPWSPG